MEKHFCDFCGQEIQLARRLTLPSTDFITKNVTEKQYDLCRLCAEECGNCIDLIKSSHYLRKSEKERLEREK